jgi:hypothetical protein
VTLSWLEIVSVLLVPALFGAGLLRAQGVVPRTDPLGFWGWAWLQGSAGVAVVLSAWLWLALPLEARWLAPVLLVLAGLAFALGRRVRPVEPAARASAPAWEQWCFGLVLVLLLVSTVDRMLLASADVLVSSDETRIWAAKARILFHAGGFGADFLAAMRTPEVIAHPDYPPLNPLLQVWVHAHAGELVHVESRLPIQAFALAGILVAASALRRRARPLVAALFLVCIGTLGRFFTYQVFSDALVAIALFACWDLWQRHQEDGAPVWLRVLGCTAPVLVWAKNEGTLLVLVFALALLAAALAGRARLPGRRALAWTAPLLASVLYLRAFNWHFGLANDLLQGTAEAPDVDGVQDGPGFLELALAHAGENARPIVTSFASLIASAEQTRYLVLAFLVLLMADPRGALARGRATFTLGILVALLGYMAVYLGTHWDVEVHLKHSAHRLVYQLTPAAGLWVLLFVVEALPWAAGAGASRSPTST